MEYLKEPGQTVFVSDKWATCVVF